MLVTGLKPWFVLPVAQEHSGFPSFFLGAQSGDAEGGLQGGGGEGALLRSKYLAERIKLAYLEDNLSVELHKVLYLLYSPASVGKWPEAVAGCDYKP